MEVNVNLSQEYATHVAPSRVLRDIQDYMIQKEIEDD